MQGSEMTMVYGTRAVLEALHSGKEFERIFIQQGLNNPLLRELREALKQAGLHFQVVPGEKLNRITRSNHQGVIAYLSQVTYYSTEDLVPGLFESGKVPLILILDRITDTRNLGAIARTAECSGVHALVIPSRGSALINGDAMKASAGALHHLPVCREDNLKNTIDFLHTSGFKIAACTEKADILARESDLTGPLAVIMGSEENGVSQEYLKRCDVRVKLPMQGSISSYNVSVAAGMVLYEIMCQRNTTGK
ncbi:MAG: 23S rRNA (guanosine(2251)-2'-O)-methyltransferase RlmB [Bacteroidia bacterium]|nr:23S rRNA (guanosine(2251)-2'-O)-methyltransferase RlmB [Bacteroidia bacterium]